MNDTILKPEKRIVQLRLTKELYRRIRIGAVWKDMSASAIIRAVMTAWLDNEDKKRAGQGLKTSLQEAAQ